MIKKNITINSRKYDGRIHRSWKADLIQQDNSLLVFLGEFEFEVKHPDLGIIRRGTKSYEYYWLDRWYNIFKFHEPNGDLRNYYCNINKPPTFNDNVLNYIDLDLDILVWKDFSYILLDQEEYLENSKLFNYKAETIAKVSESIFELKSMIYSRKFPFDYHSD